jgi:hypothetical protein
MRRNNGDRREQRTEHAALRTSNAPTDQVFCKTVFLFSKGDGNKKVNAFHFCCQNREKQLETEE